MDAIGPRMNDLALGDAAFGTPSPRPASGAAGETPTPQELAELRKTAQDFEAVFLNNEEVEVQAVYRDPVHDFGFFQYDPSELVYIKPAELPLAPGAAAIGREIRVVGNDAGERADSSRADS